MAISGSFSGSFGDSRVQIALAWSTAYQYKRSGYGYSVINVTLSMRKTSSAIAWSLYNAPVYISVAGQVYTSVYSTDMDTDYSVNTWYTVATHTFTVQHDANGAKSCVFECSVDASQIQQGFGGAGGTEYLNAIPMTFSWTSDDNAKIKAGQPVSNITAAKWNTLNSYIRAYINGSYSYTAVSAGDPITKAQVKAAADALGVTLQNDNIVRASYFTNLRDRYNAY